MIAIILKIPETVVNHCPASPGVLQVPIVVQVVDIVAVFSGGLGGGWGFWVGGAGGFGCNNILSPAYLCLFLITR